MKPDPREPMEQPGPELGSVQQEARTCPVCGTKFFATGFAISGWPTVLLPNRVTFPLS
jgi:hypothetical protein